MRGPLIETEARKIFNQGVSEGIDKNRKKTALKLLNRRKMTIEEIAEDTGLSVAEVERLADCNIMTEKEKMQHQLLYNANCDEVLLAERRRAKEICQEFNQLDPSATGLQEAILKSLLGKTKDMFCILAPFWCDYGYNIEIGEDFFANHNMVILDGGKVTFGDHVFIGPDCGFYTSEHPIDYDRRNQGLEYAYPITVGDNVWIGAGVRVMPGVTIGSDVVIGGGSVVVKDIPSHSVAVGNPCRVIRQITEQDRGNCR